MNLSLVDESALLLIEEEIKALPLYKDLTTYLSNEEDYRCLWNTLDSKEKSRFKSFARDLLSCIQRIIENSFETLSIYHGTYVRSEKSFRSQGIVPPDSKALLDEIKKAYPRRRGEIDQALATLRSSCPRYEQHNSKGTYFVYSLKHATKFCSHHTQGSELQRTVLSRLSIPCDDFFKNGRPAWIECHIPFNYFYENLDGKPPIISKSLQVVLRRFHPNSFSDLHMGGGCIRNGILPEYISKFHYQP